MVDYDFEPSSPAYYQNNQGYISSNPTYGYLAYGLFQGDKIVTVNYMPQTFGLIIATTGGQASGLIGIFAIIIGSYQGFAYDKSAVKRFYRENSLDDFRTVSMAGEDNCEIRSKMRTEMTRSNDFSISYGSYMILSTLDCICCCLTKFCDSRNWYKRKMLRYKRLELAKQKLQGELSIVQYLTMKRQSLFLFKTWLNRRQRTSVKFFKRYTVQNSEIDKDWDN